LYDVIMLNTPTTISELISHWPTVKAFADDIEVAPETAAAMKRRNRIAPYHWARVILAAEERKVPGINQGWLLARCQRPVRRAA
jgi:ribosomal protein S19E (S16A)